MQGVHRAVPSDGVGAPWTRAVRRLLGQATAFVHLYDARSGLAPVRDGAFQVRVADEGTCGALGRRLGPAPSRQ